MAALPPGTELLTGAYLIEGVLGTGGFGITYRALDTRTNQPVALKEFFPEGCRREGLAVLAGDFYSSCALRQARELAKIQEAALRDLRHQGLVTWQGQFEANGTVYCATELAEGPSLHQILESNGPMPVSQAAECLRQLARAVHAIHDCGLLHLDIKPENVVVTGDGDEPRLVLIDYDLVQAHSADDFRTRPLGFATRRGTPGYAPPEQYGQQAPLTAAADVYALGATFVHLLTGKPPVAAPERNGDASPFEKVEELPEYLKSALDNALALKIEDRPGSAAEFLASLEEPEAVHQVVYGTPQWLALHPGMVYRVTLTAQQPAFPTLCVCCFGAADRQYDLTNQNGRWTLPLCVACEKHRHANQLAGSVTAWGSAISLAVALGGVAASVATETFWPILLGPAGIFINIYSMSYGGLKHSRAEDMMKDVCTDVSQPVTHVFNGKVHIWRFKNALYADEFMRLNAASVA